MSDLRNTHDHSLLSDRLLDLRDEAQTLADSVRQESAFRDSPELLHLRSAHDSALDLVRDLTRAAKAAKEGE